MDDSFKLAFREHGIYWRAFIQLRSGDKEPIELGSIAMRIVIENPDLKQAFMDLMIQVMEVALKEVGAKVEGWSEPQPAPESERAGRA